jgi:hypothetical protein
MAKGTLKTNSVHLQAHEYHTVKLLLEDGANIELVPTTQIKGLKMPDIMVDGLPWEIKAPEGNGKNTIQHNMKNAAHQSENVIIDLCRCKLDETTALKEIQHHFNLSKRIRRLKVITKSEEIIDFHKQKGVS